MGERESARVGVATAAVPKRSALVQNVFPLLASLSFHTALLVIGLLTYQSVRVLLHRETQTVVGDTPLVSPAINMGLDDGFRGDQNNPAVRPTNDLLDDPVATGWNRNRGSSQAGLGQSLAVEASSEASSDTLIGIGHPTGRDGHSGSAGDGGPLAPYGVPRAGGGANIFRLGPAGAQRPRSVAYLCDASGSMLQKFAALQRELDKAIQGLQPVQSFSIHFFTESRAISLSSPLLMATPENKLRALSFLENISPRGSTDPIPSLEVAFKQKPQLIFLLTDGDFPDNAAVLTRIRQLNKDHHLRINTIAFVGGGDSDTAFIALLQQIARENEGTYRHVTQEQLQ
jgi:hypothetical protein